MKDKWINAGYEGDDLKPHIEPVEDYSDPARIGESTEPHFPELQLDSQVLVFAATHFYCFYCDPQR